MDGAAAARGREACASAKRRASKELGASTYVLYGTLAEIFGRADGFNKGMGGSMHAFFPPFGVMPNNAIVGGSADIATGAALFKRVNRQPGIVIANIGDASMGCGPVWEAMMFAAMDQYRTLWARRDRRRPPILFNFMNNFYGMGGQPRARRWALSVLARVGLGVNPKAMHAERVDGYNPLAVADAIERKRKMLEAGAGRCCWIPSPIASPAIRRRMHRPTATQNEVDAVAATGCVDWLSRLPARERARRVRLMSSAIT